MRPHLLLPHDDFDPRVDSPVHPDEILADLEIPVVLEVMCGGDEIIRDACRRVLLRCCTDVDVVQHRQRVFADCLTQESTIRELYALACDVLQQEHDVFRSIFTSRPEAKLRHAVQVFTIYAKALRALRDNCHVLEADATSPGLQRMCRTIRENLDDTYLASLSSHIERLRLKKGLLLSGQLGWNGLSQHLVVRTARSANRTLFHRNGIKRPTFSYTIPDRDENGFRSLGEFRDRGLSDVAMAADQSSEDVRGFFRALRFELGFYVGGLNLVHELDRLEVPMCTPRPEDPRATVLVAERLHEIALAIESGTCPVPVGFKANEADLIVITGANRGGKSTTLRAIGQAHLLMQAGLPVAAESFAAALRPAIFTHFKREEDEELRSGKFDEELRRMSDIVHDTRPRSLLLCNESFSATNEAEGSRIGYDTISGFVDATVTVAVVTHMYDLSYAFLVDDRPTLFLRAERGHDGDRPFRLIEAPPLPTSYGGDIFAQVFGVPPSRPASLQADEATAL